MAMFAMRLSLLFAMLWALSVYAGGRLRLPKPTRIRP